MLEFFFSEICGCSIILPFPIITPKNSIVYWNSCILLLLIIIPCSSNFFNAICRCPMCFFLFFLKTSISSIYATMNESLSQNIISIFL